MVNFFIADLHICHENVLTFDNRPFADINEMHRTIVDNRNRCQCGLHDALDGLYALNAGRDH